MQPFLNPPSPDKKSLTHPSERPVLDRVLVNKWIYPREDVQRGDIVLLKSPLDPSLLLIKRVAGLEGDNVCTGPPNQSISGDPLVMDPLHKTIPPPKNSWIRIPQGHFWVESDAFKKGQSDSLSFGPVPYGLIVGRVDKILYPPSRFNSSLGDTSRAALEQRIEKREDGPSFYL
jgi:signal peptidase I